MLSLKSDTIVNEVNEKLIIVTGFGVFEGHEEVNASWEAVKLLPEKVFSKTNNYYKIEKHLVPVTYTDVDKKVEEIWEKSPELVIHCGVHGCAKTVHIENSAYNKKFNKTDYSQKSLPEPTVCLANNGTCERLETKLNVNYIAEKTNQCKVSKTKENPVLVSDDPGSYLCGYIYLKSLDINCQRSLFIHVPPIDKPFTSEETSILILEIIQNCIEQIEKENCKC